jgi:hypothetical protein
VTIVGDGFFCGEIEGEGDGAIGGDHDEVENAVIEHSGEGALARGDCQSFCGVIPNEGDCGVGAAVAGVGYAVVFVEDEAAVGAGVDQKRDGVGLFLGGVLEFGTYGEDGAGADVEGDFVEGGVGGEGVNVRQQEIAQAVEFQLCFVSRAVRAAEFPDLAVAGFAVDAE